MNPRMPIFLVAVALSLSACQTMTPQERRAADESTCAGYGFQRGTEAMATCLLKLDLDRRADARSFQRDSSFMSWQRPIVVERRIIVERRS